MSEYEQLPQLAAGVYRHWRGQHYLALAYARSDSTGEIGVVYAGLETAGATDGMRVRWRVAVSRDQGTDAWWDLVSPVSGGKCAHPGKPCSCVPRFAPAGSFLPDHLVAAGKG